MDRTVIEVNSNDSYLFLVMPAKYQYLLMPTMVMFPLEFNELAFSEDRVSTPQQSSMCIMSINLCQVKSIFRA